MTGGGSGDGGDEGSKKQEVKESGEEVSRHLGDEGAGGTRERDPLLNGEGWSPTYIRSCDQDRLNVGQ